MTKMTYAQALDTAINFLNENIQYGDDFSATVEKLEALKTQLAKRSGAERKPTKAQVENEGIKARILETLTAEGQQCKAIAEALGISGQKCSALLKQMVDNGLAQKYTEKRVTYFKVVEA